MLNGEPFSARLEGVRVASTFTGFCNLHDTELFRPLESKSFAGTSEQCLLLAFRSACREFYAKQGTLALEPTLRELDRGKSVEAQLRVQKQFDNLVAGTGLAVKDLQALKASMEACIAASDFTAVHAYIVALGAVPEFMASAMLNPEYDFNGRFLQSLGSPSPLEWLSFSLIATDTGGAMVLTWIGESRVAEQLVESLHAIPDGDLGDAIVRFAFEMTEDVYASPAWWDGLTADDHTRLLSRMETGGVPVREPRALVDDGLRTVRWPVISRKRL